MLCNVNKAYKIIIKIRFRKVIAMDSWKMKVFLVVVILLGLLFIGACDRGSEELGQADDSDRVTEPQEMGSEDTRESLNAIGWQEEARSIREDVEAISQDFMYRIDNLSSMEEWNLVMEELNEAVNEIYDAIDELHEASDELFNVQENLFEVRQAVWETEQEYVEWEETTQTDEENEISDEEQRDMEDSLYKAAELGNLKQVKSLLQTGADPNKRGEDDITPLHIVSVYDYEEIARLLLDHGADVNAVVDGEWTSLHWAAMNDSFEVAKILLDYGADINARNVSGYTPLRQAMFMGHTQLATLLRQHGGSE